MKRYALIASLAFPALVLAGSNSWPQFRGPNGTAVADAKDLPVDFGPSQNLRWRAELPGRGLSCPVIAGGKVFLTANSGMDSNRLHVLAFDLGTGKRLWERQFWTTGQTLCHPKTCMACPTIATDGKSVYALFATGDVVALSADGDVRWVRSLLTDYPKMLNHVGRSSSPVLVDDILAVLMENQGDSFLFGIDAATGKTRWKAERPPQNNWNTPLVVKRDDATELVIASYKDVTAYDVASGSKRWSYAAEFVNPIVSPIAVGDAVVVSGRGLMALKPESPGAKVEWTGKTLGADTPTPVVADGKVYTVARSFLKCGDATSGKQIWDLRVKGPFSASPVIADGKLYLCSEDGTVTVVKVGDKPEILATNELGDKKDAEKKEGEQNLFLATPAVADDAIFFRSDRHLWCVGGKKN